MDLFENGVGRPSNETLKKRKVFKVIIVVVIALVLVGGGFATYKLLSSNISGKEKQAATTCDYQFSQSKCNGQKNATVKAIQQRLWNLGYYKGIYSNKNSAVDGIFGPKTTQAIKKFQKAKKLTQDGIIGPQTFEALFSNQKHFTIQYPKTSYALASTDGNRQQKILNGVTQKISTTQIKKSGYTPVGWEVTTIVNGNKYVIGCYNKDCRSGAKGYIYASVDKNTGYYKDKNGKTIYPAIYNFGTSVSQTGWVNKQVLNFNPKYCKAGYYYNKANSTCTKNAASSGGSGYNNYASTSGGSGKNSTYLSGYGWDCCGGAGYTASGYKLSNSVYTYKDKTYGEIRIIATNNLPMYSVVDIYGSITLENGKTYKRIRAIVLDTGVSHFDLAYPNESTAGRYAGYNRVTYNLLRRGK